ncbi:MAG: protease complex subunit PrcB family protein [Candidatus Aureabacteria bacterium]|nr:protease complex subunit PrcB family protein [Candidatus Auribacterota bacterium]
MRRIWAENITGSSGEVKNAPAVNWKKECVIAVFIGARPTAGYAVQVKKVTLTDSAVEVGIEERKPSSDAMVAQVISSPYCAITCARADFPLDKILMLRLIGEEGKVLLESPAWSYRFMDVPPDAELQKGRE